jgi:cyclic-di-GMP-binding biofilm dispersal mediator protein
MEFAGKNILVIGASGALGAELVRQLSASGASVLGTAKNVETANSIPAEAKTRLVVDLENQQSIDTLVSYLISVGQPINGIINAAGVVGFGKATDTSATDAHRLMQINHLGPAAVIAGLYPLLTLDKETGSFVASITGVVAERTFQGMSAYCSSKSAHSAFLSTIAQEWRRDKIQVTEARPGHTETGLASRAIFGTAPAFPEGMTASHVVSVTLSGIAESKPLLTSSDF